MIKYIKGNIFYSKDEAIINPVNLMGVMGKGLALKFKKFYFNNFRLYKDACIKKEIDIGKSFVCKEKNKYIINFPTKVHWSNPSKYEYIEKGLDDLKNIILKYNIKSISIPPLGCGLGGLDFDKVKKIIEKKLSKTEININVYQLI